MHHCLEISNSDVFYPATAAADATGGDAEGTTAAVGDALPVRPCARPPRSSPSGGIGSPKMDGLPPAVAVAGGSAAAVGAGAGAARGTVFPAVVRPVADTGGSAGSAGGHLGRKRPHICCRVAAGRMPVMNLQILSANAAHDTKWCSCQHRGFASNSENFELFIPGSRVHTSNISQKRATSGRMRQQGIRSSHYKAEALGTMQSKAEDHWVSDWGAHNCWSRCQSTAAMMRCPSGVGPRLVPAPLPQ